MLEKKLSFKEWRGVLIERMKKYQLGEDIPVPRVKNNDVPEFLYELDRFIESSRKAKIMVSYENAA